MSTYYAEIQLEVDGEQVVVDARPSDSIALGLRSGAQILVADEVMSASQVTASGVKVKPKSEKDQAAELRRMLEEMDPRDFGKMDL
jgi:bifunctional DNase/RNase